MCGNSQSDSIASTGTRNQLSGPSVAQLPHRAQESTVVSVMVSTMMCRRVTLHEPHNGDYRSPMRIAPRRNSIPPAKALTGKHLLAYLPRPPPESTRFTPYPKKVPIAESISFICVLGYCSVGCVDTGYCFQHKYVVDHVCNV